MDLKRGGGRSMIRFPLVIAVSERDMPGFEPGPQGWHTSALTNELVLIFVAYLYSIANILPMNIEKVRNKYLSE